MIITDLEGANRPPTTDEENDICIVCFGNYNDGNNLCSLTCNHNFHFACIDQWLRTQKVVWYVEKVIYDASLIKKIKKGLLDPNSNIIYILFSTLILI